MRFSATVFFRYFDFSLLSVWLAVGVLFVFVCVLGVFLRGDAPNNPETREKRGSTKHSMN